MKYAIIQIWLDDKQNLKKLHKTCMDVERSNKDLVRK